ncbi:MAG: polysaccharide deacetylase family protein [Acidimicrobiia bacterium]
MKPTRLLMLPVGVALVHALPSVVALGQWSRVRSLPGGWCRWRGPDVSRVALTFDDGPDLESTPRVLDRLEALGLRGTFFCLGNRVQYAPDLVVETVKRGHEIAVHGFDHEHHLARTSSWIQADLDAALDVLGECGVAPRWYRPPYGQASFGTMLSVRRRGLDLAHWSVWGREWEADDARTVADRVCGSLERGSIVLLHDSDDSSPAGTVDRVIEALGPIADDLARRDLTACTLSDLVA